MLRYAMQLELGGEWHDVAVVLLTTRQLLYSPLFPEQLIDSSTGEPSSPPSASSVQADSGVPAEGLSSDALQGSVSVMKIGRLEWHEVSSIQSTVKTAWVR